jgi:hypothetical protein
VKEIIRGVNIRKRRLRKKVLQKMEIIMDTRERVDKALNAFIEQFRLYIVTLLTKHIGKNWEDAYSYTLNDKQRQFWDEGIKKGRESASLIDWSHLKVFTMKYKDALREDFGRKTQSPDMDRRDRGCKKCLGT